MGMSGIAGGMPYMQGMQAPQRNMAAGGVNPRQQADNSMARKALPLAVAENAGRAATEAKGMFVDTYA